MLEEYIMDVNELINDYTIIRSSRKTLGMQIKDGSLIVRVPYYISKAAADRFVKANASWIEKQLNKADERKREEASVRQLTEDEVKELADKAAAYIPGRVRYYAPLIGVTYGRITIRCQKTRWGSCSSKGNLNFNCLLMLTPEEVIDSVIVHELCHRKEMNHSARFYSEVLRVFPEYHKWDRWLKNNGRQIMAMTREFRSPDM